MPCVSSTNFHTTNVFDVNWTVTVINQRRLPPVLLTTPRITPTAHHRGRGPLWWIDTKISNSKSDLQCRQRSPVIVPFNRPHTLSRNSFSFLLRYSYSDDDTFPVRFDRLTSLLTDYEFSVFLQCKQTIQVEINNCK